MGPTGVGKTHSMRTLASNLGLPFVIADATGLVPSGVVGLQIEDIMLMLWRSAEASLNQRSSEYFNEEEVSRNAHTGVVFLDEFDKLATRKLQESEGDANRRLVQRRLLKFVEGDYIRVGVKHRGDESQPQEQYIDSSKLLIIVGGAFTEITSNEIQAQRTGDEIYRQLFGSDSIVSEDVTHYGFLPELSSRLPLIVQYESLTDRDLEAILRHETESPLCLWREYFDAIQMRLTIDEASYRILATDAAQLKMGARGLHQLIFPYMTRRLSTVEKNGDGMEISIRADDLRYRSKAYQSTDT
ncbi:AAA family ATPase [Streptomyces sp. R35]|uniref:AAA family ATPase n=1 Tax=Streptomyces sp. R35 TaxID=3238630 RepID=A0AB39SQE1_9ACTN